MDTPESTPKKLKPIEIEDSPNHTFDLDSSTLSQSRTVGSLVLLTRKFVQLMKNNNGEIDLKDVSEYIYTKLVHRSFGSL